MNFRNYSEIDFARGLYYNYSFTIPKPGLTGYRVDYLVPAKYQIEEQNISKTNKQSDLIVNRVDSASKPSQPEEQILNKPFVVSSKTKTLASAGKKKRAKNNTLSQLLNETPLKKQNTNRN